MKFCTGCNSDKNPSEFPKDSRKPDGLNTRCKTCCAAKTKAWRKANPEKARASETKWRQANPEVVQKRLAALRKNEPERVHAYDRAGSKRWRQKNPDKVSAYSKKWRSENLEKDAAASSARRALRCQAMPSWLSDAECAEMRAIYRQAAQMTEMTGIAHHVDHYYPLKGESVCGLHVPWNLRVITARENQEKWRKIPVDEFAWLPDNSAKAADAVKSWLGLGEKDDEIAP